MTALTVSAKFYLDRFERNTMFNIMLGNNSYASGSGAKGYSGKKRMRVMMDLMLDMIDFRLHILEDEYDKVLG